MQKLSLEWFDSDFKKYFNFDIYDKYFDKEKGYSIYEVDKNIDLLLIRLDKLNTIHKEAFEEFFGWHFSELYNFNKGSQKKTSELNNRVKKSYQ